MSERYRAAKNKNDSKNTRLPIREEFSLCRFNRDALAHISRYLLVCERIIELAKEKKRPLRWLDIGCGDVYLARTLNKSFHEEKAKIVAEYVGFDIDDKKLSKIADDLPGSFPIRLVMGDFTCGDLKPFHTMSFDVVTCLEVTEHVKPQFVLPLYKDIARLAPEAWISTPNWPGGTGKLPKDHIKEWDVKELVPVMNKAGMRVVEQIGIFCNLTHARQFAKIDGPTRMVLSNMENKFDGNFLSLVLGRMLGERAQNILYHTKST
jgi:2-polyprenyl-3-methyl-5-hydroxy-6-metoxy-1,4-benzoquinol methylase